MEKSDGFFKLALIGRKLGHSFSANYFNDKFQREGIGARYLLFEMPDASHVERMIAEHPMLKGFNVTIPYKKDILPYLDGITHVAREIGAVNTVYVWHSHKGIRLIGHNTDAAGFEESLLETAVDNLIDPAHWYGHTAIVLGQGGASEAVKFVLRKLGMKILAVSRRELPGCITYGTLTEEEVKNAKVIVNCTPLGMYPDVDTCPEIPYRAISPGTLCFDLVYNPQSTRFMQLCRAKRGVVAVNGLDMLRGQADAAWRFWQGITIKKTLYRKLRVISGEASACQTEELDMQIVERVISHTGEMVGYDIYPYERETAGVEYVAEPYEFKL